MKAFGLVFGLLLAVGCGYQSKDNEAIGQVKRIMHNTPIICSDYADVDISLGVMRNGVGSMSTEDAWFYVKDDLHLQVLERAAAEGKLVKVHYDRRRLTFCVEERWLTSVEIIE